MQNWPCEGRVDDWGRAEVSRVVPCTPVALTYERLPSTLPSGKCIPTRRGRLTTAVQAAHIALRAFPHGARLRCGSEAGTLIPGSVRTASEGLPAPAARDEGPFARSARSKTGSSMKFVFHVQVAVSSWILTTQMGGAGRPVCAMRVGILSSPCAPRSRQVSV